MNHLFTISKKLIAELGSVYVRDAYKTLQAEHRIVGIVGGRGVGKTTYMLYYLRKHYNDSDKALYVSADDVYFSSETLISLVDQFIREKAGQLICIDEIHKYPNWSQELKNIYDRYPRFKVIFSGSSSINLVQQKYDLSRRAVLRYMYGFSFREYLESKYNVKLPILSLDEVVSFRTNISKEIWNMPRLLGKFKEYLQVGYYPICNEYKEKKSIYESLMGIVEKTIYTDIASYYVLKTPTLKVLQKILYFIYTQKPSAINPYKIARSLKKDNKDVVTYLDMLQKSGLLRYLLIDKSGHALIRNTEKVYLNHTNFYYTLAYHTGRDVNIGAMRELFVISQLENAGYLAFYSKLVDICCDDYSFEIGGKNKDAKQIVGIKNAYLVRDDVIHGDLRSIPLYLFGFLY